MVGQELRVLSIQSHVVSGYVGNKSATFPLQLLGFEVDAINSVQLSNHTGYKVTKGDILNDKNLSQLVDGLVANDLHHYSHLLTGYVGSASFLEHIAQLIPVLKTKNPNLIYLCDPVLGDDGKLYVPEELIEIYKKKIVPLADIITPNQFELELLTDKKITTIDDVKIAMKYLYEQGPKTVVVSSIDINDDLTAIAGNSKDEKMIKIDIPKIPLSYVGSGDLFAALFLAHSTLQSNLKEALEKTINTLHAVLLKTMENVSVYQNKNAQEARKKELRLIQSKHIIENPPMKLKADLL
ncbi:pyridoxal kinase [Microplitis mediator]|uniref:pyridoxal kinase n=1 Tax=Microplitis mediator TaxID=375433 RepID=UPI002557790D|nr:pyridoxal kinase [Microplitis mediator]XP_057324924.1 pyridoxal kinase [Microplitis mediator]XP_057324925.1 pyridoxal kinase [Microplitis mediator]XP_057324926.1 pyridoxal kinase [Microplitis mediator]